MASGFTSSPLSNSGEGPGERALSSTARMEDWINRRVEFFLRHWVASASIFAALVVAGAVAIPLLEAGGFDTLSWAGYKAYRLICPQRPDHSWFIAGHKMGFEQRDTAMFAAAALAGPLYVLARRFGFKSLDGRLVLLLQIPIFFDVFSQMIGLRDSDGLWRAITGTLSVLAIAGWLYPRIDDDFQRAVEKIHVSRAEYEKARAAPAEAEPVRAD